MTETMGFNMAAAKFRSGVINQINGSGIPITTVLFILKDIVREAEKEAEKAVEQEVQEYEEQKQKKSRGILAEEQTDRHDN